MGLSETLKAISVPERRQILKILKNDLQSAGYIASHFNLTWATVSYHLSILKKAGVLEEYKFEKNIFYAVNFSAFEDVLTWIKELQEE